MLYIWMEFEPINLRHKVCKPYLVARLLGMKVEVHQLPTCQLPCGLLLPPAVGLWPLAAR